MKLNIAQWPSGLLQLPNLDQLRLHDALFFAWNKEPRFRICIRIAYKMLFRAFWTQWSEPHAANKCFLLANPLYQLRTPCSQLPATNSLTI